MKTTEKIRLSQLEIEALIAMHNGKVIVRKKGCPLWGARVKLYARGLVTYAVDGGSWQLSLKGKQLARHLMGKP